LWWTYLAYLGDGINYTSTDKKKKIKPHLLTEGLVWSICTQYFGQETAQQHTPFAIVTLIVTVLNLRAVSVQVIKILPTILASSQYEVIHFWNDSTLQAGFASLL
jgi:hypothetical protein